MFSFDNLQFLVARLGGGFVAVPAYALSMCRCRSGRGSKDRGRRSAEFFSVLNHLGMPFFVRCRPNSYAIFGSQVETFAKLRHNWRVKSLDQLAERLRAERVRQGLSQAELARRARIPLRSYQRLESADPGARLASLLRALTALGLELDTAVARRPTLDDLSATYGHEA